MQTKELHIALRQAIEQFGYEVLTESRLTNILLDFGAYTDFPAAKTIMQSIVSGGYGQKIIDLGRQKRSFLASIFNFNGTFGKPEGDEWREKLGSFSTTISKNNGFQQPLVDYVMQCVAYGLSWVDDSPKQPSAQASPTSQPKPLASHPKPQSNGSSSGTQPPKTSTITYNNIGNTQFFVVKVTPADATVYVDDLRRPVSNGIMAIELPVGFHTYEVEADGYQTKSGSVKITQDCKYNLDVKLEPEQKMVQLSVESGDFDAEIFINGVSYGRGKWEGMVQEGIYDIDARKHRYYSQKKTVNLNGKDKESVFISCLIPKCGNLKVNVQPYGSKIIINGSNEGTTPLLVQNVVIGERKLTIKTSEGTEYTTIVEVRENQVTEVNHVIPSLFLDDYSKLQIGDYYYEDGTFSHVKAEGKNISGVVFSLKTSKEEKAHEWTHGQIVAVKDAKNTSKNISSWGVINNQLLNYAITGVDNFGVKDTGYEVSHLDCVMNNPEFVPFIIASQYDAKLPFCKTSGWYLPSIVQWRNFYDNTHARWLELWTFLELSGVGGGDRDYASSTPFDHEKAWKFHPGKAEQYRNTSFKSDNIHSGWGKVRAVAAF